MFKMPKSNLSVYLALKSRVQSNTVKKRDKKARCKILKILQMSLKMTNE